MHILLKSSIAPLSYVSITFSLDRFPILTISHTHENDDGQVLSCIDHFVSEVPLASKVSLVYPGCWN